MQAPIIRVAKAIEHDLTRSRLATAILVRHNFRRIAHVEFSVSPHEPHGKDKLVDEHSRVFVSPVAVAVLEHADAALTGELLQRVVQVQPG